MHCLVKLRLECRVGEVGGMGVGKPESHSQKGGPDGVASSPKRLEGGAGSQRLSLS